MQASTDFLKNADRFSGFADIYEDARPRLPLYPVEIICRNLDKPPERVLDLGCGTGLSTTIWAKTGAFVTGVEPSRDMLEIAKRKATEKISFMQAYAHEMDVPDASVDVAICSQSFHWMEPRSTLKEINRVLRPGGIFAAVDCDWPPVAFWKADSLYAELYAKVKKLETETKDVKESFVRFNKDEHLKNIRTSGYFRYTREILFSNTEKADAERYIKIILSQGSTQAIIRKSPGEILSDIEGFKKIIRELWSEKLLSVDFSYRMRFAVK